ncbi:ComC/BlpC family leader-containing pheromone/bacteriocin [Hymenobacter canadensis]|uniref:ComC/BlpC family leader-containing pheromone/bacteriocin n=1 Tax=Hymenobacter canadensis TaxID=2999067 RepID=A0ABY7LV53_9BACT|nr:ComC/BlpC family leader-containing pheromone/bacteriocin [Hymenobacter canadensis]WBA44267.1 ComC/BlpC family leader-containing pheromone/bacteriocin [Hymenobacter canadensis]
MQNSLQTLEGFEQINEQELDLIAGGIELALDYDCSKKNDVDSNSYDG